MQTRGDVYRKVSGLCGDPFFDWLTPDYFSPLCETAYEWAIQYLKGTCSPYIRKRVLIPGVPLGGDESNLTPYNTATGGNTKVYPLKQLMTPIKVEFRQSGLPTSQFREARECIELPNGIQPIQPQTYDIRVWGDFLPMPLVNDDSVVEIHPNAGHALAFSIMALIGAERPNAAWVENYGVEGPKAWDEIASDLIRQQQHLPFRLGSPNRRGRTSYPFGFMQACPSWEWRSFQLLMNISTT